MHSEPAAPLSGMFPAQQRIDSRPGRRQHNAVSSTAPAPVSIETEIIPHTTTNNNDNDNAAPHPQHPSQANPLGNPSLPAKEPEVVVPSTPRILTATQQKNKNIIRSNDAALEENTKKELELEELEEEEEEEEVPPPLQPAPRITPGLMHTIEKEEEKEEVEMVKSEQQSQKQQKQQQRESLSGVVNVSEVRTDRNEKSTTTSIPVDASSVSRKPLNSRALVSNRTATTSTEDSPQLSRPMPKPKPKRDSSPPSPNSRTLTPRSLDSVMGEVQHGRGRKEEKNEVVEMDASRLVMSTPKRQVQSRNDDTTMMSSSPPPSGGGGGRRNNDDDEDGGAASGSGKKSFGALDRWRKKRKEGLEASPNLSTPSSSLQASPDTLPRSDNAPMPIELPSKKVETIEPGFKENRKEEEKEEERRENVGALRTTSEEVSPPKNNASKRSETHSNTSPNQKLQGSNNNNNNNNNSSPSRALFTQSRVLETATVQNSSVESKDVSSTVLSSSSSHSKAAAIPPNSKPTPGLQRGIGSGGGGSAYDPPFQQTRFAQAPSSAATVPKPSEAAQSNAIHPTPSVHAPPPLPQLGAAALPPRRRGNSGAIPSSAEPQLSNPGVGEATRIPSQGGVFKESEPPHAPHHHPTTEPPMGREREREFTLVETDPDSLHSSASNLDSHHRVDPSNAFLPPQPPGGGILRRRNSNSDITDHSAGSSQLLRSSGETPSFSSGFDEAWIPPSQGIHSSVSVREPEGHYSSPRPGKPPMTPRSRVSFVDGDGATFPRSSGADGASPRTSDYDVNSNTTSTTAASITANSSTVHESHHSVNRKAEIASTFSQRIARSEEYSEPSLNMFPSRDPPRTAEPESSDEEDSGEYETHVERRREDEGGMDGGSTHSPKGGRGRRSAEYPDEVADIVASSPETVEDLWDDAEDEERDSAVWRSPIESSTSTHPATQSSTSTSGVIVDSSSSSTLPLVDKRKTSGQHTDPVVPAGATEDVSASTEDEVSAEEVEDYTSSAPSNSNSSELTSSSLVMMGSTQQTRKNSTNKSIAPQQTFKANAMTSTTATVVGEKEDRIASNQPVSLLRYSSSPKRFGSSASPSARRLTQPPEISAAASEDPLVGTPPRVEKRKQNVKKGKSIDESQRGKIGLFIAPMNRKENSQSAREQRTVPAWLSKSRSSSSSSSSSSTSDEGKSSKSKKKKKNRKGGSKPSIPAPVQYESESSDVDDDDDEMNIERQSGSKQKRYTSAKSDSPPPIVIRNLAILDTSNSVDPNSVNTTMTYMGDEDDLSNDEPVATRTPGKRNDPTRGVNDISDDAVCDGVSPLDVVLDGGDYDDEEAYSEEDPNNMYMWNGGSPRRQESVENHSQSARSRKQRSPSGIVVYPDCYNPAYESPSGAANEFYFDDHGRFHGHRHGTRDPPSNGDVIVVSNSPTRGTPIRVASKDVTKHSPSSSSASLIRIPAKLYIPHLLDDGRGLARSNSGGFDESVLDGPHSRKTALAIKTHVGGGGSNRDDDDDDDETYVNTRVTAGRKHSHRSSKRGHAVTVNVSQYVMDAEFEPQAGRHPVYFAGPTFPESRSIHRNESRKNADSVVSPTYHVSNIKLGASISPPQSEPSSSSSSNAGSFTPSPSAHLHHARPIIHMPYSSAVEHLRILQRSADDDDGDQRPYEGSRRRRSHSSSSSSVSTFLERNPNGIAIRPKSTSLSNQTSPWRLRPHQGMEGSSSSSSPPPPPASAFLKSDRSSVTRDGSHRVTEYRDSTSDTFSDMSNSVSSSNRSSSQQQYRGTGEDRDARGMIMYPGKRDERTSHHSMNRFEAQYGEPIVPLLSRDKNHNKKMKNGEKKKKLIGNGRGEKDDKGTSSHGSPARVVLEEQVDLEYYAQKNMQTGKLTEYLKHHERKGKDSLNRDASHEGPFYYKTVPTTSSSSEAIQPLMVVVPPRDTPTLLSVIGKIDARSLNSQTRDRQKQTDGAQYYIVGDGSGKAQLVQLITQDTPPLESSIGKEMKSLKTGSQRTNTDVYSPALIEQPQSLIEVQPIQTHGRVAGDGTAKRTSSSPSSSLSRVEVSPPENPPSPIKPSMRVEDDVENLSALQDTQIVSSLSDDDVHNERMEADIAPLPGYPRSPPLRASHTMNLEEDVHDADAIKPLPDSGVKQETRMDVKSQSAPISNPPRPPHTRDYDDDDDGEVDGNSVPRDRDQEKRRSRDASYRTEAQNCGTQTSFIGEEDDDYDRVPRQTSTSIFTSSSQYHRNAPVQTRRRDYHSYLQEQQQQQQQQQLHRENVHRSESAASYRSVRNYQHTAARDSEETMEALVKPRAERPFPTSMTSRRVCAIDSPLSRLRPNSERSHAKYVSNVSRPLAPLVPSSTPPPPQPRRLLFPPSEEKETLFFSTDRMATTSEEKISYGEQWNTLLSGVPASKPASRIPPPPPPPPAESFKNYPVPSEPQAAQRFHRETVTLTVRNENAASRFASELESFVASLSYQQQPPVNRRRYPYSSPVE